MEILLMLVTGLSLIIGIGSFACWIMVIVSAFQNEDMLMGILSIVLCGLGAFVIGWIKHSEWEIKPVMLAWTGLVAAGIVVQVIAVGLAGAAG